MDSVNADQNGIEMQNSDPTQQSTVSVQGIDREYISNDGKQLFKSKEAIKDSKESDDAHIAVVSSTGQLGPSNPQRSKQSSGKFRDHDPTSSENQSSRSTGEVRVEPESRVHEPENSAQGSGRRRSSGAPSSSPSSIPSEVKPIIDGLAGGSKNINRSQFTDLTECIAQYEDDKREFIHKKRMSKKLRRYLAPASSLDVENDKYEELIMQMKRSDIIKLHKKLNSIWNNMNVETQNYSYQHIDQELMESVFENPDAALNKKYRSDVMSRGRNVAPTRGAAATAKASMGQSTMRKGPEGRKREMPYNDMQQKWPINKPPSNVGLILTSSQ